MEMKRKYIKYTKVDFITRKSCIEGPCKSGPDNPSVEGLEEGFCLESQFPTSCPVFYGTCNWDANTEVSGVLGLLTKDEYEAAFTREMRDRFERRKVEALNETIKDVNGKLKNAKQSLGDFEDFILHLLSAKEFLYTERKDTFQSLYSSDSDKVAKEIESRYDDYLKNSAELKKTADKKLSDIHKSKTEKALMKALGE